MVADTVELVVMVAVELTLAGVGVYAQVEAVQVEVDVILALHVVVETDQLDDDYLWKTDNLELLGHVAIPIALGTLVDDVAFCLEEALNAGSTQPLP